MKWSLVITQDLGTHMSEGRDSIKIPIQGLKFIDSGESDLPESLLLLDDRTIACDYDCCDHCRGHCPLKLGRVGGE
jgi:hypothetical protein